MWLCHLVETVFYVNVFCSQCEEKVLIFLLFIHVCMCVCVCDLKPAFRLRHFFQILMECASNQLRHECVVCGGVTITTTPHSLAATFYVINYWLAHSRLLQLITAIELSIMEKRSVSWNSMSSISQTQKQDDNFNEFKQEVFRTKFHGRVSFHLTILTRAKKVHRWKWQNVSSPTQHKSLALWCRHHCLIWFCRAIFDPLSRLFSESTNSFVLRFPLTFCNGFDVHRHRVK